MRVRNPETLLLGGRGKAPAAARSRALALAGVAVPWLVFGAHALLFASWIVDDAGISFVYARNLAAGHGLVSQPGAAPVEGYSNPLWVLAAVPFFALGVFDPIVTPKLLSLLLVGGAFAVVSRTLSRIDASPWVAPVALTFVALNTSFVAWSTSGLENPLYVFLVCVLCDRLAGTAGREAAPGAALTGGVAGAIALTRPEGVLYAALYPLVVAARNVHERRPLGRGELGGTAAYAAAFGLVAGGYLAFRWLYFGDLMPNTYYAKGGPEAGGLLLRTLDLLSGVGSHMGVGLALGLAALSLWLAKRGGCRFAHLVLGLFVLWSALAHLLLPPDWMGEYRFATPFFVFFYAYAVAVFTAAARQPPASPGALKAALLAVALVAQVFLFAPRSAGFARRPTVPFTYVAERFAAKFDEYAARLGVEDASLLLPDVGATLYYSRLRIHDLVGLTDATAARTYGKQQVAYRDYVFERLRPTFIHLHEPWALRSGFDLDRRFRRDYLAIVEYESTGTPSRTVRSGDFVRRDAVRRPAELAALRRENAGLRP